MLRWSIDLSIPNKCDIIILDDDVSNLKFKSFSCKKILKDKINLFCFLKTIFFFWKNDQKISLKKFYKKNLYRMYSPKVAISHDKNGRGEECKKLCPEIIVIIYQFSYFHEYYKKLRTIPKGSFDYFLTWNNSYKNYFKNYSREIIVAGSVRNNSVKVFKSPITHKVLLLSEYSKNSKDSKNFLYRMYLRYLKIVDNYCLKNNLKLLIALRSLRKDKNYNILDEKNFYRKYFKCKIYFNDILNSNSYQAAKSSNLIFSYHTTLGFELLSRKMKVFFMPFHERRLKKTNYLSKKNNFHIHRNFNEKIIFKKIKLIYTMSRNKWLKKINKQEYLGKFDQDNTILNRHLIKIIKKKL